MHAVNKLDSKNETVRDGPAKAPINSPEGKAPSFVSGNFGVTAKLSFHINSPWKVIGAWIKKLAA
jgi:hypothetical protein